MPREPGADAVQEGWKEVHGNEDVVVAPKLRRHSHESTHAIEEGALDFPDSRERSLHVAERQPSQFQMHCPPSMRQLSVCAVATLIPQRYKG